jgi:hypothetical protein
VGCTMTFCCNGITYDTIGMRRFDTGRLHEPAVFVTADHAAVFVQTMGREFGVAIHRADATEVALLWRAYACPALARVLGLRGAGVVAGPARGGPRATGLEKA